MKTKVLLLIIWMIFTLLLVCSVIGMVLFARGDFSNNDRSTWMSIGYNLVQSIIKN